MKTMFNPTLFKGGLYVIFQIQIYLCTQKVIPLLGVIGDKAQKSRKHIKRFFCFLDFDFCSLDT